MDYKPVIIDHVQRSIGEVNDIVVTLQKDRPLTSDILDMNYPQASIDKFHHSSRTVVDTLRSASEAASTWLKQTGDQLSQNLVNARSIEASIRDTSSQVQQTDAHAKATQERINVLNNDINNGQSNLGSAQNELNRARDKLKRERKTRDAVRIGAVASLFFAPVLSVALATVSFTALENAVDQRKDVVHRVESQLAASRAQLQAQQAQLTREHAESARLAARIHELQTQSTSLSAEVKRLENARADLAELSKRINDCLHTVDAALSSSKTIEAMCSMRNVVTGIRGVVGALGNDAMFQGPLAQLDDAALGALDRRVVDIKRGLLIV